MQDAPTNTPLSSFQPAKKWRKTQGGHIFTTDASLDWFVRKHRKALIDSGQFIVGRGHRPNLVGPDIDWVVLEIFQRESQRSLDD